MLIRGSGVRPMTDPIIRSLLDLDFYKLTMLQFIWAMIHGGKPTKFRLHNRTQRVGLGSVIPIGAIRDQLDHVTSLRFEPDELDYLASLMLNGKPIFVAGFIEFLRNEFQLSQYGLEYSSSQKDFVLEPYGRWDQTSPWETMMLSIVNELYYHYSLTPDERAIGYVRGSERLRNKVARINAAFRRAPDPKFDMMEFGTRRRFSREWQRFVLEQLMNGLDPGILSGTSNVALAREFGLTPKGTIAHEIPMIYRAIYNESDDEIRRSQMRLVDEWDRFYEGRLNVALPDTFGSEAFLQDFGPERARRWKAFRQDSGVPEEFGDRIIRFYQGFGIDPLEKKDVPSDGLTTSMIETLADRFCGRIGVSFGPGTHFSNDLGFLPISIVVKAVEANGIPLVKLSDNLNKAMGPVEEIERMKRIFGYTRDYRAECVY